MKTEKSQKELVVAKKDNSPKIWMAKGEYTNVIVGAEQSDGAYVISDGLIAPGDFIPAHYHLWEDQSFHVIEGELEAKIGDTWYQLSAGDTVHCPRNISHYMKNTGDSPARLLSYIFPGTWAEAFMEETAKQNHSGNHDPALIEEKYGVVYI